MTGDAPKKRRGRPPIGVRAMTAAERQRFARLRRLWTPRRLHIEEARNCIQSLNFPLTRIQEAISEMDDGEQREQMLAFCERIWKTRKEAINALRKAEKAPF